MPHFADLLMDEIDAKQSRLVVGLDPRIDSIPNALRRTDAAPCSRAADMILRFNRAVIDIAAPLVPAVKVQVAFYETFGPDGVRAYEATLEHAARKGLVVIGDVKRSDIGSTAEAYAAAHLGHTEFDGEVVHHGHAHAVTVTPYFGWEGIEPFLRSARWGKGIFVMVRSSNSTAHEIQGKQGDPDPLFLRVARNVNDWGRDFIGARGYSAVGAVVGATYPEDIPAVRALMPNTLFLLPGYGAQGAQPKDLAAAFDKNGHGAVIAASRKIILAHRDPANPKWEQAIETAIRDANAELAANLPPLKTT